jgi:hypothetical protein
MSQELRPSSCLLFIPQYEYGEPRWNDMAGELLIRRRGLSGSPISGII